jgi:hypothetical protein
MTRTNSVPCVSGYANRGCRERAAQSVGRFSPRRGPLPSRPPADCHMQDTRNACHMQGTVSDLDEGAACGKEIFLQRLLYVAWTESESFFYKEKTNKKWKAIFLA